MTGMVRKCVCSSLLVAVLGIPAVLSAPSTSASTVSTTKEGPSVQQRPYLTDFVDWNSIRDKTICPAQVAYNQNLRVLEVWCADGVEGQTFEARGEQYVCRSLRYTINYEGTQVDVVGGCIARLDEAAAKRSNATVQPDSI